MRSSSLLLLAGLAAAPLACGDRGGDTTGTQTTSGATDTSTGSTTEVSGTTQPTSSTSVATTTGETIADVTTDPSSGTGDTGTTGTTGATGSTGLETGDTSGSTGSEDTASSSDTSSSGDSGGGIGEGESCQDDPDGCKPGLLCCYPCGIPDCENKCIQPDPQTQMCPLFP